MSHDATRLPPKTSASPEKMALLEAFDSVIKNQVAEREAELRAAEARRRARTRVGALGWSSVVVLVLVGAYLWIAKPEWLFPSAAQPESAAVREASLRIGVATAAQHVRRFQTKTGRLPETLVEAGVSAQGISYQRLGSDQYQLGAEEGELHVTFASQDSLPTFVGRSFEVIGQRSR
jgi:hypothetical protein